MPGVGFDRDEPPRGERQCEGRLRPSSDWVFKGWVYASGIDARRGQDAVRGLTRSAKARPEALAQGDAKPVPRSSEYTGLS